MADVQPKARSSAMRDTLPPVIGGLLGLAVAMGFGRFAYTPLLPVMRQQAHLSAPFAGVLASWNYFGYLIGALLTAVLPAKVQRDAKLQYCIIAAGLLVSAASTAAMGLTGSHLWWCVWRGIGGLCSAIVLVLSSSLLMNWLARRGKVQEAGLLYSGVGVGIALTGVLVPFLTRSGWQAGWQGLGWLGGILALAAILLLRRLAFAPPEHSGTTRPRQDKQAPFPLWIILLVYGLEGLGYIVMATFITDYFHSEANVPWLGTVSWIFVGLAAAPSTWLWTKAAQRWGWGQAAVLAYAAQAIGILLPSVHPGIGEALAGSLLFGGTFMGIVSLTLAIGRMGSPDRSGAVIGTLTTVFSVGQMIGPLLAGLLTAEMHTFRPSMLLSGFIILAAALLLWRTRTA